MNPKVKNGKFWWNSLREAYLECTCSLKECILFPSSSPNSHGFQLILSRCFFRVFSELSKPQTKSQIYYTGVFLQDGRGLASAEGSLPGSALLFPPATINRIYNLPPKCLWCSRFINPDNKNVLPLVTGPGENGTQLLTGTSLEPHCSPAGGAERSGHCTRSHAAACPLPAPHQESSPGHSAAQQSDALAEGGARHKGVFRKHQEPAGPAVSAPTQYASCRRRCCLWGAGLSCGKPDCIPTQAFP